MEFFGLMYLGACMAGETSDQSTPDATQLSNQEKSAIETDQRAMNKEQQIENAVASLARWKKVSEKDIELLETRSITWRSGALGCPKKGMAYTLALVPGRLIILRISGKAYRYHADLEGPPFFCPDARSESTKINSDDL